VDIVTKFALKEMMIPALLPVVTPILVGFSWQDRSGRRADRQHCHRRVRGHLDDHWRRGLDNAKKYIEDGHLGGKGSDAHKAAVTATLSATRTRTLPARRQPDDQDSQRCRTVAGSVLAVTGSRQHG